MLSKLFFLFLLTTFVFAGDKDKRVLNEMAEHQTLIGGAARALGISPRLVASVIYAERYLNYNWEDDLFDELFAESGYNSSIGYAQIKVTTAFWIEQEMNNPLGSYFVVSNKQQLYKRSKSRKDLIEKLINDTTNIYYCSAYLAMIKHRWEKIFLFEPNNEVGILATLYSLGIIRFDGTEHMPHVNPQMNYFGETAQRFYDGFMLRDVFE